VPRFLEDRLNRTALPLGLIVLDGWGEAPPSQWNAVRGCHPENMDALAAAYPTTLLQTAGEAVGLPPGQIGNSEVGHLCLGAGRIVLTDLERINREIASGSFDRNALLNGAVRAAVTAGGAVHLMGLLSDGGVHSHINHLKALLEMARRQKAPRIFVHAFLDGRDTPPRSAIGFVRELEGSLRPGGPARIATVMGRFYAMDRDNRWERIEAAYRALVKGEGITARSGVEAVEAGYARDEGDEFLKPTIVVDDAGKPVGRIRDRDSVIFFNFRADRARELTRALTSDEFDHFDRGRPPYLSAYVCFGTYDRTFDLPVAFPNESPARTFGELVAEARLRQLRIAETEKYAHVTFFFNGGREKVFEGEDRILVSSPKIATYDLKPEMSAPEVTAALLERLREKTVDFFLLNFANADMVGHSGIYEAAVRACKEVDRDVGEIVREVLSQGGAAIVTADHGNSEQMWDPQTNSPHTAHTTNPVPLTLASEVMKGRALRSGGVLADVAPTLLEILEIPQPAEMTGKSLLA
jgi:2,3-bisphosphoglycerate-independent phosphoglycerate mutase